MKPLVSVITPTWQRHELLINQCIPSVQAQLYRMTEHVIVSDGPDPELGEKLARVQELAAYPISYVELPRRWEEQHWGHLARLAGIDAALGEYIAYIDDDDALRPNHVKLLAQALDEHPKAWWAYSAMASHNKYGSTHIGLQGLSCGQIGTPMIMHRRSALEHGTWGPASSVEDWQLIERWTAAGLTHVHVPEVTVDVWPSAFRE